jgi:hypothetical protein
MVSYFEPQRVSVLMESSHVSQLRRSSWRRVESCREMWQVYVLPAWNSNDAEDSIVGKTLAYTSIQFTNAKGEIAARGSHTKYVACTYPHDAFLEIYGHWRLTDMLHWPGSTHKISLKNCHLTENNELSEGHDILVFIQTLRRCTIQSYSNQGNADIRRNTLPIIQQFESSRDLGRVSIK